MKVIEFRLLNLSDDYGDKFNDGSAWSRVYEYPLVIKKLKELGSDENSIIHNSSWGYDDIHIRFKNELDSIYRNAVHSDIRHSELQKTFTYNITSESPEHLKNKFDFIINISTVEEVHYNHFKIIQNLYDQLKVGGYLIITFDYPGLDLPLIENNLKCNLQVIDTPINGINSRLQNSNYGHLNCGLMIINKEEIN
jgi:SAM-dependent methyltransferase